MNSNSEDNSLDAMLAAASAAYDKRLSDLVKAAAAANDLTQTDLTGIVGQACEDMMRESLPPLDTPNTTEDGLPRAMTISCMTFNKLPNIDTK
jgi:hypothetical protein